MTNLAAAPSLNNPSSIVEAFKASILDRTACVGIIGLGYVGLPLARTFNAEGFPIIGFDVDEGKVEMLNQGQSYIGHIPDKTVQKLRENDRFVATTNFADLKKADAILICVPTPLTKYRDPDMTYVVATTEAIMPHLRKGHLIILESTTYPGTTQELMRPILERSGLRCGEDFFLAYSPEREDPGNPNFETASIPKVVGGDGKEALELSTLLYEQIVPHVVTVSSSATAEAVKLTENIFRCVNIALVNELKVVYDKMGIDVWEVIDAAKTKPFGFMPFYPGPGLGGHCIPIDPFYLTWKAREYGVATRFIELAGQINTKMPGYVLQRLREALDQRFGKGLKGAKILILGAAYKKNVDDIRESPSLQLLETLQDQGVKIAYYDPYVPFIHETREHPSLAGLQSIEWSPSILRTFDVALICTDHDDVNYEELAQHCPLIIDTRNAMKNVKDKGNIVKA